MDFNKNFQKNKFNQASTSRIINQVEDRASQYNNYNENLRSNTLNRNNKFPPIYFYKKISIPYKYNISSVPEYLIKTNEEKRFINKLYKSLTNEKDRNTLKDLLYKNKKKINFRKDNYKPKYIDVQKLLKYRPSLYTKFSDPLGRNTQVLNKINNSEAQKENIFNENNNIVNSYPNTENILINKEKNENENDNIIINEKKIKKINEELTKEEQIKYRYNLSDIFNLRKEPVFLNKSAEKYLFRNNKSQNDFTNTCPNKTYTEKKEENKFYTSSESKSDWIPNKINNNKMGTNSSVSYNILCPSYAGTNRFINAKELNKNNLFNESTAFHRVKSISEFIDLTRVTATNTLGCFNRRTEIPNFRFNNNICANQLDAYHINRNIIEKPI